MKEGPLRGLANRVLQHWARILPGASNLRVKMHRVRGVMIGKNVWIGYDVILDTSRPSLITLEDNCTLSMRVTVVAHFRETTGVKIERDVFVGPGAIILPGVVVGHGAVVTAGSVVTRSVPPMTVVQGNPAVPIARCGIPLVTSSSLKDFSSQLRPVVSRRTKSSMAPSSNSPTLVPTKASK
jgi:serine acetyltransferase